MKKLALIFVLFFVVSCAESVPGRTGDLGYNTQYDLNLPPDQEQVGITTPGVDTQDTGSVATDEAVVAESDVGGEGDEGALNDLDLSDDDTVIVTEVDTEVMQGIFSVNGIASFYGNLIGWSLEEFNVADDVETEEEGDDNGTVGVSAFMLSTQNYFANRLHFSELVEFHPEPKLTKGTAEAAWLVAFETTGGALKYVKDYLDGSVIEHGKKMNYNGIDVVCDSYIEGTGVAPKGGADKGEVKVSLCRKKIGESAVGNNNHSFISGDYLTLEFDHFEFWSPCLGNVRISGKVWPTKKGISSYYDVINKLESTYFFDGQLTYGIDNGSFYGFVVKFSNLVKRLDASPNPQIDDFGINGNVTTGSKTFSLKNPYPNVDENGVVTNTEMPVPGAVSECWNQL